MLTRQIIVQLYLRKSGYKVDISANIIVKTKQLTTFFKLFEALHYQILNTPKKKKKRKRV